MITVSPLSKAGLSGASRLIRDLRSDMNGRQVCTSQDVAMVLEVALGESSYAGFLASDAEGRALGFLGLNRRFAIYAGGIFFQITELYVAPESRRRGIGGALIAAAEHHARQRGGLSMELGAPREETHPGTHAFYASMGYGIVGPRLSKTLTA